MEQKKIDFEKYERAMTRKERLAMERFAEFMAKMIDKYGPKVLAQIEEEEREKNKTV